ncbi:MAG: BsuPI-related putative proteinase inhibitor [Bryobacteraceae bacterium]
MHRLLFSVALLISSALGADFFPLEHGNIWTYRNAATGSAFTVKVGAPVYIGGRVYHYLTGYIDQQLLVRIDERNELVVLDEEAGRELTLTSFQPDDSNSWEAPFRPCMHRGQTLVTPGVHNGPTGPVRDVLEVRYSNFSCADAGVLEEQYAENLGMVRRTLGTIAGPRVYDLESASVGSIRINALPNGSFDLAVLDTPQNAQLTALLKLRLDPTREIKLRFPTGQEFDLVVRDETGRTIWKWSDGQVFTAGEHERSVNGEWSFSVTIPQQVFSNSSSQAREYTIQVWLTTAGAPGFAATVPLTVSAGCLQSGKARGLSLCQKR